MTFSTVASFAADITIVNLLSDEVWTVCLNGIHHCHRAQIDRTGRNVLATCSPAGRTLRVELAEDMFGTPCGLRAALTETFADGQRALADTASLPLLGDNGLRKIVTYAVMSEDIEEPFRERPMLQSIEIAEYRFVDLGYGVPVDKMDERLIA